MASNHNAFPLLSLSPFLPFFLIPSLLVPLQTAAAAAAAVTYSSRGWVTMVGCLN